MGCAAGHNFVCNYYPACPEPNRTMGASKHSDPDFFTILLQDQIGGLQILYQNQWADIPPVIGALVVNLGDLFQATKTKSYTSRKHVNVGIVMLALFLTQLISNDKFKSAVHGVLANQVGPRISVACYFSTHVQPVNQIYGPIKELLSDDNPPLYRETLVREYAFSYALKGLGNAALALFRL
nr:1-aminocyclopropane-1-carboxylate oxidase like 7 [Quercus suber]